MLKGERKLLKLSEVKQMVVPHYDEVSTLNEATLSSFIAVCEENLPLGKLLFQLIPL